MACITPQNIVVDYIVENTIGKLIESKTPKQVEKIKICDPACGSGSFLIGAYQFLLDWHLKYYTNNLPKKPARSSRKGGGGKKNSPLTPDGNLTTAEKKRILLNNIFGVDIDTQAVEVTKLNLLLKALEGETQASINQQLSLFHERVLPHLGNNIKCGNSLIGPDFYNDQLELFPEQMKKINAFDWELGFPEIFKQGGLPAEASAKAGFDVVIGNPPYVRQELLGDQKDYFKKRYKVYHGVADLYTYFFEKGIQLLNKEGLFGIIVANKWMRANYGEPLRKWLKTQTILRIIDFGDLPVFQGVTTYPCIVFAGRPSPTNDSIKTTEVKTLDFESLACYVPENEKTVSKENLNDNGWQLVSDAEVNLLKKLQENAIPLEEYVQGKIYRGVLTGLNEAFVIDKATKDNLIADDPNSEEIIKPFLAGRDIKRYKKPQSEKYLILFPRGFTNKHYLGKQPWNWLKETYSAIALHLEPFADKAQKRWDKGDYWWELRACEYYKEFEKPKIIVPSIAKKASYTFDTHKFYSNDKTSILPSSDFYLLGVLNSKVSDFYLKSIASTKRGGYFEYKPMYVSAVPIIETDKETREQIVKHVNNIRSLNKHLQTTKLEIQRQQIQRTIDHTEKKIDELVYRLYGLSEEEIEIIENTLLS